MNNKLSSHDALKLLARAWKHLRVAEEVSTNRIAIDNLRSAGFYVYQVGEEKFGKEFYDEVKRIQVDA